MDAEVFNISKEKIWSYLKEVLDPEVPVLSIVDLGIVRDVIVNDEDIEVVITPTYSGCPAMKMIEHDIISKLKEKGLEKIKLKTILSPVWTTDWISDEAKQNLKCMALHLLKKLLRTKVFSSGKRKKLFVQIATRRTP